MTTLKPGNRVRVLGSSDGYPLGIPAGTEAVVQQIWETQELFPIELKGFSENVAHNEVELVARF